MPTASKLFSAFAFLLVGFFTAEILKPHAPPEVQFGNFSIYCALIGFVAGWRVLGPESGRGWWWSANAGLRTSFVAFLLGLAVFSTAEMLKLAYRRNYDNPFDAILGIISVGIKNSELLFQFDVMIVLLGGGMLAGCLSEWVSRRWS